MVPPHVLRAPMRSRLDVVDHAAALEWALDRGVLGVGGRLRGRPAGLDAAVVAVDAEHGERVAARLVRFAAEPVGTFAWTRDDDGHRVGRLAGPWRFDASDEAFAHDLVHVRTCPWSAPVPLAAVPGPVLDTFARGGRNLQRTRGADLVDASDRLWREHGGADL